MAPAETGAGGTEPRDRNAAGLDDAVRHLAELRASLEDVRERLEQACYDGRSDDERITARVDSTGRLVALDINPRVFRSPDAEGLAASIVLAVQRAAAKAVEGSTEIVREVLGADLDPDALLGRRGAEGTPRNEPEHLHVIPGGRAGGYAGPYGPGDGPGPGFGGWAA